MLETMTEEALCGFIPGKAARITTLIRQERPMELKQALLTFYRSDAYKLLEREETKLWHASPAQIYAKYLKPMQKAKHSYRNGPHHSKLAPYAIQIREWHARGLTLREMADELEKYGCKTTPQNLSLFLRKTPNGQSM
ncbi:MAG: hypothetical protein MJ025_06420 [Victivallaceae bacterium]|nr:hypothetical protein [Victivallaceae bacterium]